MRVETGVEKMRRALQGIQGEGMGDTTDEPPLPEVPDGEEAIWVQWAGGADASEELLFVVSESLPRYMVTFYVLVLA